MRPRNYLSWSALNCLEMSEQGFVDNYLLNKKIPVNRGMALGSLVAWALESGEDTGDLSIDLSMSLIPRLDETERKIETEIVIDNIKIPLLSYLDISSHDLRAFKEVKTGTTKWTQDKVDKFGQITFYCLAIKQFAGYIPNDIELVWLPSIKNGDGSLSLSDEVFRFKTKRTEIDILKMKIRIKKAWLRIEELTNEYLF